MLNTVHLQTFLTVVELGTYSAAAERLHLSQPAVSQHIDALEKELGEVRLFRRVAQRMVLTHAGEELLPAARNIIGLAERTQNSLLALRGHVSGTITIACASESGAWVLPSLIHAFRQQHPHVHVRLDQVAPSDILARLEEGEADFIWHDEYQRRRGWEFQLIGHEDVTCCVAPHHEWVQQRTITAGMASEQPLIMPTQGSVLRRQLDEQFRRAGVPPNELNIVLETNSVSATLSAIQQQMGVGFVPVTCQPAQRFVQSMRLSGFTLQLDWYMLNQRETLHSVAAHLFRQCMASDETARLLRYAGITPHTLI